MTVLIDGKLENPLIKDKKVSLLGGVICGQKVSMGSVSEGSSCSGKTPVLYHVKRVMDDAVKSWGRFWGAEPMIDCEWKEGEGNLWAWRPRKEERRWEPGNQVTRPGWVIPPGAQKSGQIFDSCPGSETMQGVLDWIRAGLPEDRGHKEDGYGWSRGMAWEGNRLRWCEEEDGGGCGGRFGTRGQGKGGEESFHWILLGFEEEGVAGQNLGGGAHQGQSGWSKTTGAMVL
ncbi:hypothetical protein PPACK8108_LOCUS21524 [Phakopsora pachyrhizi]|uniref:Uncharacterized protein n=1 Tax=Phakopsora pachyrhizi TaxID=170000 RepID=A0AAV0BJG5_PHAPC|nr:hypothetical protein PPACK8108_LOCUS21524 [Phakopsora pachyrhizi]